MYTFSGNLASTDRISIKLIDNSGIFSVSIISICEAHGAATLIIEH